MLQWHHFLKGAGSGVQQLQQHQTSNKEVITQFEQDDSAIDSVLEDEGLHTTGHKYLKITIKASNINRACSKQKTQSLTSVLIILVILKIGYIVICLVY